MKTLDYIAKENGHYIAHYTDHTSTFAEFGYTLTYKGLQSVVRRDCDVELPKLNELEVFDKTQNRVFYRYRGNTQERIDKIVHYIVCEGVKLTHTGMYIFPFADLDDEQFVAEHADKIMAQVFRDVIIESIEVITENGKATRFDVNYYLDYCPNYEGDDE